MDVRDLRIEIATHGGDMRMAEAEIRIGGRTVGYVGGSAHESTVRENAEKAVIDVFAKMLADHPEVDQTSRFNDDESSWS